ncbi:MAG: hypothetical protein AMXMBFR58_36450 [Phycisphaerae bacterium]
MSTTATTADRRSVYQTVTDRIVAALERGVAPWVCPWDRSGGRPQNGASGHVYRGINVVLTGMSGYGDARWFTYRQAQRLGGQVRRGEKGTPVVFWQFVDRRAVADGEHEGEEQHSGRTSRVPFAKTYVVFNAEQIEWTADSPMAAKAEAEPVAVEAWQHAATGLIAACGADIRHGGTRAYYSPTEDYIRLPEVSRFNAIADYHGTCLHELAHWTGHANRLGRNLTGRFGGEAYAAEELVAELAAAFMSADLGVPGKLQHEEYIGNWITLLGKDTKAIFTAARLAQDAADFLLGKVRGHGVVADEHVAEVA